MIKVALPVCRADSPPAYYEFKYGAEAASGINMDRGGFGHSKDGTNYGCVFDGVTAGGAINAHAAQAFAEYLLRWLQHYKSVLSDDEATLEGQLQLLFQQCSSFKNNRRGAHDSEGGSATAVMATFRRQPGPDVKFTLVGGYVGDAACIVVHPSHGARLITKSHRREDNPRDTGGQIIMAMGVHGRVVPLLRTVVPGSLVILTTDGFTDNVLRRELDQIVPLIVESTFFQNPVPEGVSLRHASRLPDYEELFDLVRSVPHDSLIKVSVENATRRLSHYIAWVTSQLFRQEQEFYKLSIRHQRYQAQGGEAATAEAAALEAHLSTLCEQRKHSPLAGKTDDCILLVMKPYHSVSALASQSGTLSRNGARS